MKTYVLEREIVLPRPPEAIFPFFADARNLETITPPWLRFRVLTSGDIIMREGACIDYALRVRGIPIRWTSTITRWDPPHTFVDEQVRGPYRLWRHTHGFREHPGGTCATDRVEYAVPGGPIVHALFVGRDVRKIFDFRHQRLVELFGSAEAPAGRGGG